MANKAFEDQGYAERLLALEQEVRSWAKLTRGDLIKSVLSLDLHEQIRVDKETGKTLKPLKKDIRYGLRKKQADLESVAFKFPRHGIFLERGVGKHRKVGSSAAARAARPWLFPVLDDAFDDLVDLLEEAYADLTVGEFRLLIPGVIDKKRSTDQHIEYSDKDGDYKVLIDKSFF